MGLNLTVFAVTRQGYFTSTLYATWNDFIRDVLVAHSAFLLLPLSESFRAIAQPVRVLLSERSLRQLRPHNSDGDCRQPALHRSPAADAKGHWQFLCFAYSPALRLQNHDQDRAGLAPSLLPAIEM